MRVTADTLCIVHLGGNDLLHSLWLGPIALLLLYIDLVLIVGARVGLLRHTRALP